LGEFQCLRSRALPRGKPGESRSGSPALSQRPAIPWQVMHYIALVGAL